MIRQSPGPRNHHVETHAKLRARRVVHEIRRRLNDAASLEGRIGFQPVRHGSPRFHLDEDDLSAARRHDVDFAYRRLAATPEDTVALGKQQRTAQIFRDMAPEVGFAAGFHGFFVSVSARL